jgi:hypothetical protein
MSHDSAHQAECEKGDIDESYPSPEVAFATSLNRSYNAGKK